jgi:lipopolysaccharide biosynthesis glycosyltransferase
VFKSKYVKQVIKIGERVHHDEKHVLLCCSKGYIKRGGVTLTSVILSNQDMHFTFHIVCDDIVDDDLTKIKATCEKFKTNIILYILEENIINKLRVAVNETMHCTVAAFFRIIGFDILSESFDRVLCLDSDIIVLHL